MEYILIDPAMLMLQGEEEIMNNIDFFRNIIDLSNSKQISLCLYEEVLKNIISRQIAPFPIKIQDIKDKELKESLLLLNDSFNRSIMNNYQKIDIDNCQGSQEFTTDRMEFEKDSDYYAFFSMLLTPCYASYDISEKIMVGEKSRGLVKGEQVTILCNCEKANYERTYIWVSPEDLLTEQQKAVKKLSSIIKENNVSFVSSPEIKKSEHHNHVQGEDFNCYKQLSSQNKRVLNYLRYFGLYRIIFENFSPDTSYEVGTVKIVKVAENDNSDIIAGWFYGCMDFKIFVEMYFPKGIGRALEIYTCGEISRIKMEALKTELAL